MNRDRLVSRLREVITSPMPLLGCGQTAERHRRFIEVAREDLSLARLAEAHWDALAILSEARHPIEEGAIYGVWAAEGGGKTLRLEGHFITGQKPFCSGAGVVDRALVTVKEPQARLIDVDLRERTSSVSFEDSSWKTTAFAETKTSLATFDALSISAADFVGEEGFYLTRPGFWHGACGPAACWAGGAVGLLDWAGKQKRNDPHTLAHLGAMEALVWSMRSCLKTAGDEIDVCWSDIATGQARALKVRHLIEQSCTDILRRLARAYGPHPLAFDEATSQRYHELDLYLRQCHAERDLEMLGRCVMAEPFSSR